MIEAPGHNSDCSGIYVREKALIRTSGLRPKGARFFKCLINSYISYK